jgi:hypothetical protein
MASFFKNRLSPLTHIFLSSLILLTFTASDLYSQEPLENEISKALRKSVKCERIEIKTKAGEDKSGKLKSLFIKFVSMPKNVLPADFVTVQYTNPKIDFRALRKSNTFKVASYSDFKIGMLVSEQTVRNEFEKTAKRFKFHYNKLQIKFTPPYIELEFDIPASAIPAKDRNLVDKFIKNKRLEGYAALRLEVRDNKIFVSPAKVILNHFLLPAPLVAELKKRINPVYRIPRLQTFDYALGKAEILKQYIYFSN